MSAPRGACAQVEYTRRDRFWLSALAVVGFVGINGAFAWALVRRPEDVMAALRNPVAAAFVVEALLLVGVLGYLLRRWKLTELHWAWFVALSLAGSLAFALPVALLWRKREQGPPASGR